MVQLYPEISQKTPSGTCLKLLKEFSRPTEITYKTKHSDLRRHSVRSQISLQILQSEANKTAVTMSSVIKRTKN